jgi:hydroxyacyl-ACP dehydratase HTD2-like protein with hotdog domain
MLFLLSTVTNMLHLFTTCREERQPSPLSMTPALVLRIMDVFGDERMTKLYFALIYLLFPNPFPASVLGVF